MFAAAFYFGGRSWTVLDTHGGVAHSQNSEEMLHVVRCAMQHHPLSLLGSIAGSSPTLRPGNPCTHNPTIPCRILSFPALLTRFWWRHWVTGTVRGQRSDSLVGLIEKAYLILSRMDMVLHTHAHRHGISSWNTPWKMYGWFTCCAVIYVALRWFWTRRWRSTPRFT